MAFTLYRGQWCLVPGSKSIGSLTVSTKAGRSGQDPPIALCTISSRFMYMMLRLSMVYWVIHRRTEYLYLWATGFYGTGFYTIPELAAIIIPVLTGVSTMCFIIPGRMELWIWFRSRWFHLWHRLSERRILVVADGVVRLVGTHVYRSSYVWNRSRPTVIYGNNFYRNRNVYVNITERISTRKEAESLPVMYEV